MKLFGFIGEIAKPDLSQNFVNTIWIDSTPKVAQKGMIEVKLENDSETCEDGK
jgi:hypothetical protein